MSGLICLDWYDWNYQSFPLSSQTVLGSGLICLDWYDWNNFSFLILKNAFFVVRIDLFGLIRLKQSEHSLDLGLQIMSGLICLDWYDWNVLTHSRSFSWVLYCQDWSVWIDTIETLRIPFVYRFHILCQDWSVWIDTIETIMCSSLGYFFFNLSGLICLDWYDWNSSSNAFSHSSSVIVRIDLFGLIRLKPCLGVHTVLLFIQVRIDLFGLIRLKHQ